MGNGRGTGLRRKTNREDGASEGIRTLDIHLGKVTLYQTELRSRSEDVDKSGKTPSIARLF
jgi:hypothetical protein